MFQPPNANHRKTAGEKGAAASHTGYKTAGGRAPGGLLRLRQPQPPAIVLAARQAAADQAQGAALPVPRVARAARRLRVQERRRRLRVLPVLHAAAPAVGRVRARFATPFGAALLAEEGRQWTVHGGGHGIAGRVRCSGVGAQQ